MIELANITKYFGGVTALSGVALQIQPGRVHGLLGENGAGKSTLMNVLFGLLNPDEGEIRINGNRVRVASPRHAQRLGMGMVHQHFKLVPTLSVPENLALVLRKTVREIRRLAADRLEALRWSVPLDTPVEQISVGQQQRAEIIKALLAIEQSGDATGTRTLILDEPTAVLTPQETSELFTAIDRLRSQGTAVVFISHKLAEVQRICDDVTILRRGRVVHTGPSRELSAEQMAERMVGARIEILHVERAPRAAASGTAALELSNVKAGLLKSASLRVERGEIVGIAGVDGNGQSELVQAVIGAREIDSGRIIIAGENATHHSIRWRNDRIAFIAEDRHREAMAAALTVQENLLLKDYRRRPFSTIGWLRFGQWRNHASELVKQFDVRCHSLADPAGRLSGGNQQKMVLARELHRTDKPLVIAVNPTRGLDVGATAFVMRQLLNARALGAGVLLIHSDLDELLAISDRVLVLFGGILTESRWPQETKEGIGRMMLGVAVNAEGAA